MSADTLKLTYEDYLDFPEDGFRHELIDGEHFMSSAPPLRHQETASNLLLEIGMFLRRNPVGELLLPFQDSRKPTSQTLVFSRMAASGEVVRLEE